MHSNTCIDLETLFRTNQGLRYILWGFATAFHSEQHTTLRCENKNAQVQWTIDVLHDAHVMLFIHFLQLLALCMELDIKHTLKLHHSL